MTPSTSGPAAIREALEEILAAVEMSHFARVEQIARAALTKHPADGGSAAGAAPFDIAAEAIDVACNALDEWSHDLAATRDEYIDAMGTGKHNGRRIRKELAKYFAHDFGERSSAVFGCIDVVRAAFAKERETLNAMRDGCGSEQRERVANPNSTHVGVGDEGEGR